MNCFSVFDRFSDVFSGYRSGKLVENGLNWFKTSKSSDMQHFNMERYYTLLSIGLLSLSYSIFVDLLWLEFNRS